MKSMSCQYKLTEYKVTIMIYHMYYQLKQPNMT